MVESRNVFFGLGAGEPTGKIFGKSHDEWRKAAAWATTRPIGGLAQCMYPADAALDEEGNVICLSHYGRCDSEYGWEIDHRHASALGGSNALFNLRARHWRVNRSHGGILGGFLTAMSTKP